MPIARNTLGRSGALLRLRICALFGLLTFYMGKNTLDRQDFIIENLRVEKDLVEV